jgi:acyl carrier protein
MRTETDLEEALGELLRARSPLAHDRALTDDLPLGPGGLGLDSIALVELLLDCEARFGGHPADLLLAATPLTVGRLLGYLRDSLRASKLL